MTAAAKQPCRSCGGTGKQDGEAYYKKCDPCNGKGKIKFGKTDAPCGSCGSTGQITRYKSVKCPSCNGKGKV